MVVPPSQADVQLALFHPDYTVGSGLSPDLLTFPVKPESARGLRNYVSIPPVGNFTPP